MPHRCKISVVIPVYNNEAFVAKAIESVLSQQYPAHEIIVINDGSSDRTAEVLMKYAHKIIYRYLANGGPGPARNTGIKLATGDYIAFLDADDIWFKNRLSNQAQWIEKFPEVGLFACDVAYRDRMLNFKMIKRFSHLHRSIRGISFNVPLNGMDFFNILMKENIIVSPSCVVIKRSLLDEVGLFHEDRRLAEDFEMWVRCSTVAPVILIRDTLLYKKTHNASITSDVLFIWESHGNALISLGNCLDTYIKENNFTRIYKQAIADNHYRIGNLLFNSHEKRKAFMQYFLGLRSNRNIYNLIMFCNHLFKKCVRMASWGLIKNRNRYSRFKLKRRVS